MSPKILRNNINILDTAVAFKEQIVSSRRCLFCRFMKKKFRQILSRNYSVLNSALKVKIKVGFTRKSTFSLALFFKIPSVKDQNF